MFRSEVMSFYQLLIPRESSYMVMNHLGSLDSLMIIDQNKDNLNRPFNYCITRCDDMMCKIEKLNKCLQDIGLIPEHIDDFKLLEQQYELKSHTYLNDLEALINHKHQQILDQVQKIEQMKQKRQFTIESKKAMIFARKQLGGAYFLSKSSSDLNLDEQPENKPLHGGMIPSQKFTHFVGIINAQEYHVFARAIFRITKGNFMMYNELLDQENELVKFISNRMCFLLFFPSQSVQSETFRKIKKLCETFKVDHVRLPISEDQWDQRYNQYENDTIEIEKLISFTQDLIKSILTPLISGEPTIQYIRNFIIKEKLLYENLNKLKIQPSVFIGLLWIKSSKIDEIEKCFRKIKEINPNLVLPQPRQLKTPRTPPTSFALNQFNKLFQLITDTYGVPRYREINPSIFSIITFPFLFGVMFGDIAHGLLLLSFGLYLSITKKFSPRTIQKETRKQLIQQGTMKVTGNEDIDNINKNSSLQLLYDLRYMLILCGGFAAYCGLIYNDFFALQLDIFGTCLFQTDCVYPFGIDPMFAENLNFSNSYKMKLSIIIGYFQMTLGLLCLGLNSYNQRNLISLFIVFPVKLCFFSLTIGYMAIIIFIKWNTKFMDPGAAPSIISTMVDMWMHDGYVDMQLYSNQSQIQEYVIIIASLCIPIMLFVPMFHDLYKNSKQQIVEDEFVQVSQEDREEEHIQVEKESNGDIVVHHLIETIEFVLGCISNTASYLRLWALSLAHSQLASVFFDLILSGSINEAQAPWQIIMFPLFLIITLGVLLCMDAMECFLHALRLHWVEFQSKFFKGDGYQFEVFSFTQAMQLQNKI